jgi:hypothetical protein
MVNVETRQMEPVTAFEQGLFLETDDFISSSFPEGVAVTHWTA